MATGYLKLPTSPSTVPQQQKVAMGDRIWRELRSPPGAKVHGIKDNAEQIGGDET